MSKLNQTISTIRASSPNTNIRALKVDLSDFASVRNAASEVNGYTETLDVIVNNAGIMASPYSQTADGHESQLQCNHLSHFLLTNLLLPKMLKADKPLRIVNVTSDGHIINGIRYTDPDFLRGTFYNKWLAYGQSKTANILYSKALAARLGSRNLVAVSVHPGQIADTKLGGNITQEDVDGFRWNQPGGGDFIPFKPKSMTQGVSTHVVAAFDPRLHECNGSYLSNCAVHDEEVAEWARKADDVEKLWALSEQLTSETFTF
jgi:NAD(P)-dependent dehydrogenase (short-subunit alcohol dehydrogenase family)